MDKKILTVPQESDGARIDIFLTHAIEDIPSRTFIKKLIDGGNVIVRNKKVKANHRVSTGEEIHVELVDLPDTQANILAEKIPLNIFYEDDDVVVINKPIGMTVHPATAKYTGTLANALKYHFDELSDNNGPDRPGIVHRLDRETSGLIVVAKNNKAHARLAKQFEDHSIRKTYVALVKGIVQYDQGEINAPIGRHERFHDHRRIAKEGEGKEALTVYSVVKRFPKSTLIALFPQTGRTHQLRLHMRHIGHPILGDDKYGQKESFPRLALHAFALAFKHPATKKYIEFCCPVPKEFLKGV